MTFTGTSCSWWAFLPSNLSCAVRCAFSCARFPVFLCSHAHSHCSLCFPVFPCHWRRASTAHTHFFFAFQPPFLAGSEYFSRDLCFPFVFRLQLQRHLCCRACHAAIVFCSTAPVTKQALHDVCPHSTYEGYWTCLVWTTCLPTSTTCLSLSVMILTIQAIKPA